MTVRLGLLLPFLAAGCTLPARSVVGIFPPGSAAAPWLLQQEVWIGRLADAAPGLGSDAAFWRSHEPVQVWLAVYCHEDMPDCCIKVRCFALPSQEAAQRAYDELLPPEARTFKCGDTGCWTDSGVLMRWGRLVLEIFGGEASWSSQMQAAVLATYIAKRMPPGLPENPR